MKSTPILLLTSILTSVAATSIPRDIVDTILDINSRYSSETNVFFDLEANLDTQSLQSLRIPSVIITKPVDFQFIYELDKDILAVVFETQTSADDIHAILDHVLHRMHNVNALFILLDAEDPTATFDWAWRNGYKNSLAITWTSDRPQLFEFYPFPQLRLIKLNHVNESSLQRDFTNFHRQPIRMPLPNDPPRTFRYVNRQGKHILAGLFPALFTIFMDHFNATIQEVILPKPYPNGLVVPDMLKAMNEGLVDISPQPFLQLYDQYLCTYAFQLVTFRVMVPAARPVEQFLYFVLPYDDWTWAAICATVLAFAFAIYVNSRVAIGNYEFGRALLQALGGVINISFCSLSLKSNTLHFLFVLISVTGLMLSNLYLSHLSTFLTTRVYERQINTIEEAINSKFPVSIAAFDKEVYANLGAPKRLLDKVEIIDLDTWHQQRRILNTSRIDIISSEKYSFFMYQQRFLQIPRVKIIEEPLITLAPAFALPFTSPYVSMYSDFFQRTIEAGIFNKASDNLNDDGIATGLTAFLEPDVPEMVPLTLKHFKISLFLLGGGFATGIACLCMEVVWDWTKRRAGKEDI